MEDFFIKNNMICLKIREEGKNKNNINKIKKMIIHEKKKKNNLKLEEKEREITFFSVKRMATYGYHNMVQPSILPVAVALLALWNLKLRMLLRFQTRER